MSNPDFPDGTGPIQTPDETLPIATTPEGTGPIAVPRPPPPPPPSAAPPSPTAAPPSPTPPAPPSPTPPAPTPAATTGTATAPAAAPVAAPVAAPAASPAAAPVPPATADAGPAAPAPAPAPTPAQSARSYPLNAGRQRPKALALARLSPAELERAFQRGVTPDADGLVGWEFRGHNTPPWFRLLGIQKFVKGFYSDGDGGVWGYNSPVAQDGVDRPWRIKPSDDQPKRFGFYTVRPVDAAAKDNRYLHALLLDYGEGENPRFDPSAGLRDYLVQVDRDDPDLLLGKAYYALGPLRIPTFSFFVLDRHRPGPRELARRA